MKSRKETIMAKARKSRPMPETINLEEIRRMRSLGGDFGRVGYDPFTVKFSKLTSSKHFFKPYEESEPFEKAN